MKPIMIHLQSVARALFSISLVAILFAPGSSRATDYTDVWYNAAESGQGYNIVQADAFFFVTFFIYGPDKNPTWYTAQLTLDSTGNYSGGLYLTHGTYYALPWNPADHPPATQVGTATFQPSTQNAYQGTLTYTVTGIGTVTKQIERLTLSSIALGGNYVGGQSGLYSSCSSSSQNGGYTDTYTLAATQTTSAIATFVFTYASGATCTLSGPLDQHGQLYNILNASYQCTGTLTFTTNALIYELKQTAQGVEGRFVANVGSGCQENAQFSAVLQ
jgi:hypothetical protein